MIVGTGVDLVDVTRFSEALARQGERLLARLFTPAERRVGQGTHAAERLAGTFAAKEAALKALGSGLSGLSWQELEVVRLPGGRPELRCHGKAAARAAALGVVRWHLSISHTGTAAVAQVIAEGEAR